MKPLLLILLYLVVVTLPLILSWMNGGPPRPFRHELASGLGMLAYSMILMEFVLSGRFKKLSRGIGMDVTMRIHQIMARLALAFALLHPFLYSGTLAGGPRPWDPTRQLTLTTDFSDLSTGIAAFVLLPTLVLLAVGRKHHDTKYEVWRLMHGLGAVLIAGLLLHHATYAGRYGSQPVIVWMWLALTGVAAGSLIYVYLLVPLRDRNKAWRVASVNPQGPRQWELVLEPDGHAGLSYEAGQFVWLNVDHSPFSLQENPFSISSAPAAGSNMSFVIKEFGDFTKTLGEIKPGTRAYLDGPYGSLSVARCTAPGVALIAGGVGIAPLLGILRQMRLTGDPRQIKIIYGNRREDQIAHRAELDREDPIYVLSDPPENWSGETGVIDANLIAQVFSAEEIANWDFVLCGPGIMMDIVEDALIKSGTPSYRILSERFNYD